VPWNSQHSRRVSLFPSPAWVLTSSTWNLRSIIEDLLTTCLSLSYHCQNAKSLESPLSDLRRQGPSSCLRLRAMKSVVRPGTALRIVGQLPLFSPLGVSRTPFPYRSCPNSSGRSIPPFFHLWLLRQQRLPSSIGWM